MKVREASFSTAIFTLLVETTTAPEFVDITGKVLESLKDSGINNGCVVVFSRHTTAAITIQENEPLLLNDMAMLLERLAPRNARYGHNDFSIRTVNMHEDEPENGHSHCQHILLGTSETIPVVNGELHLGEYQSIFLVELDESRDRTVCVSVLGMSAGD